MFLNVCEQTFHISYVRISQKVKVVLMWNLQHIIFIWRRRYSKIFKSALVFLSPFKNQVTLLFLNYMTLLRDHISTKVIIGRLTLKVPTPKNGQTHSNNSSAVAEKLWGWRLKGYLFITNHIERLLTHVSLVIRFIEKHALQNKWLVSIWNATLG